jgi:hypothetical protein
MVTLIKTVFKRYSKLIYRFPYEQVVVIEVESRTLTVSSPTSKGVCSHSRPKFHKQRQKHIIVSLKFRKRESDDIQTLEFICHYLSLATGNKITSVAVTSISVNCM